MSTASATAVQSFGIEVRVRRGLATVSFMTRSGRRVSASIAPQGDSTAALLSAAEDFFAAEGIEVGGSWAFATGGGLRSTGYYA